MLLLKKSKILIYKQNLNYFVQCYKINTLLITNSLKKKEIWAWPILTIQIKENLYNTFF
jgi:hypothetical protein